MTLFLCGITSAILSVGLYLLLSGSRYQVVLGLSLIGHAINLAIFILGGLRVGILPIIGSAETTLTSDASDPLPQALILTAIVIGFALQAFVLVLARWLGSQKEEVA